MNINEVKYNLGNERQKEVNTLFDLLSKNGNCSMNGYLGDQQIEFSFDKLGVLEFATKNKTTNTITESKGAVFDNNVIIKQVQNSGDRRSNQLIAWDVNDNSYTYVVFDNQNSLDQCYDRVKEANINLCSEDIYAKFTELGVSFDNVAQVLLNQKVDALSTMLDETNLKVSDNTSFII